MIEASMRIMYDGWNFFSPPEIIFLPQLHKAQDVQEYVRAWFKPVWCLNPAVYGKQVELVKTRVV